MQCEFPNKFSALLFLLVLSCLYQATLFDCGIVRLFSLFSLLSGRHLFGSGQWAVGVASAN